MKKGDANPFGLHPLALFLALKLMLLSFQQE